jgi:hypothetical protein
MKKNIKNLGIFGSVASIISVGLFFISPNSISQTSYGNSSPNISNTDGNININYNSVEKKLSNSKYGYLKHPASGAVHIYKNAEFPNDKTICVAEPGSKVVKIGEKQEDDSGYFTWIQVKAVSGRCAEKTGWVSLNSFNLNN